MLLKKYQAKPKANNELIGTNQKIEGIFVLFIDYLKG